MDKDPLYFSEQLVVALSRVMKLCIEKFIVFRWARSTVALASN